MADTKVSALSALAGADLASDDAFMVVDTSATASKKIEAGELAATQAQQETGTLTTLFVTPGRQHFHKSAAKAWGSFDGTGTPALRSTYNVDSLTDGGTGRWTITFTTALGDTNYTTVIGWSRGYTGFTASDANRNATVAAQNTTTVLLQATDSAAAFDDIAYIGFAIFGDI